MWVVWAVVGGIYQTSPYAHRDLRPRRRKGEKDYMQCNIRYNVILKIKNKRKKHTVTLHLGAQWKRLHLMQCYMQK